MKKTLLGILFFLSGIFITNAQEESFSKGDKVINLGIGFGSTLYTGTGYSTVVPPISASFEYGIVDGIADKGSIGVGGYIGYTSAKYEQTISGTKYGWEYSSFIIGARGAFHYPFVDKLDTYGGLIIGYNSVQAKEIGSNPLIGVSAESSGLAYNLFVGARYYFSPNFAAMSELGYGVAYLTLGVAFKF